VREGGGEVGGGGVGGARAAAAGEGGVDAVPDADEVQVGLPGVVGLEQAVVVAVPEELADVGGVLVRADEVGAQREVAARADGAAVPRGRGGAGAGGGGEGEEEEEEEGGGGGTASCW
jgi:hypothetical protein